MRMFVLHGASGDVFAINPDMITDMSPDGDSKTRIWLSGSGQPCLACLPFSYLLSVITDEEREGRGVYYL